MFRRAKFKLNLFQTLVLRSSSAVTARSLHTTQAAAAVAMSKFDQNSSMPYEKLVKNLEVVRSRLNRPLTLSEKVLYSHLDDPQNQVISPVFTRSAVELKLQMT